MKESHVTEQMSDQQIGDVFCFDEHWAPYNTNACFLIWLMINLTFSLFCSMSHNFIKVGFQVQPVLIYMMKAAVFNLCDSFFVLLS